MHNQGPGPVNLGFRTPSSGPAIPRTAASQFVSTSSIVPNHSINRRRLPSRRDCFSCLLLSSRLPRLNKGTPSAAFPSNNISHGHPRGPGRFGGAVYVLPLSCPLLPPLHCQARISPDNNTTVLQDPSVAASPIEKRIAFLQAKNLTQEEVSAALARAESGGPPPPYAQSPAYAQSAGPVAAQGGSPQYYGYPPYAWPQSNTDGARRDWRDLFILATVVGGASYGLYNLGKVGRRTPCNVHQGRY